MFGEGMYRKFLSDLQMYNPQLKYAGLTATPYRLGEGHLVGKETLWGLISYEAKIPQLISEGFLCPITNKPTATHFDLERMHLRGGEFVASEMEDVFADAEKVQRSVTEILAKTADRHSVIVFCSGVRHAQYVSDVIEKAGKTCGIVDGQTGKLERAGIIRAFQKQEIQYLVNIDVLTTGFDAPNIDAIAILRSTMSAGLFVQMCGRGFRIHDSKQDCLILDFGGNIDRHGPLDAIDYGRARAIREGNLEEHDGPLKSCPGCSEDIPASTRTCVCGFEFPPPELKHDERADEASSILAEPQTFPVSQWQFSRHVKKDSDKPNTLRVDYYIQGDLETTISEWVCLLHDGFAGKKARKWWAEHSEDDVDSLSEMLGMDQIDVALQLFADGEIKEPVEITAIKDGNFWRVLSRVVDDPRQREDATSIWEHEELPF
jgi:DNA repair protein RadD